MERANPKVAIIGSGNVGSNAALLLGLTEIADIVLMDIEMPNMDGLEAAAAIRKSLEPWHRPFIVALTANAQVSAREIYLGAGMDDYLSKPIDEAALLACLDRGAAFRAAQEEDRSSPSGRTEKAPV